MSGGNREWETTLNRPQLLASASVLQGRLVRQPSPEARRRNLPVDGHPILEARVSRRRPPRAADDRFGRRSRLKCTCSPRPRAREWSVVVLRLCERQLADASEALSQPRSAVRSVSRVPSRAGPSVRPCHRGHPDLPAVDNLIAWTVPSPRVSLVYDVTGDGRTLAKASYGRYSLGPGTELGFNANRNSNQPWRRWTLGRPERRWPPGSQASKRGDRSTTRG